MRKCPASDVCYSVNVPDATAASGSGDIYFQIQGPDSKQWIGLGQGGANQMRNSNIFIIYADATGSNVTLSPRLGEGEFEPDFNPDAQVSLVEGSAIADGVMTANVRCGCFLAVAPLFYRFSCSLADLSILNRLGMQSMGYRPNGPHLIFDYLDMGV